MSQCDFAGEASKSRTLVGSGAGQAQVFVNDDHLLFGPAQLASPIGEGVLAGSGFTVVLDLAWCGLPNVNVSGSLKMGDLNLGWVSHRSSPGWLFCVALTRRRERISRTARFCSSSNCSHRCVSGIGISWKFRFSCGMALLACHRSYRQVGGPAQQSIG